MISPNLFLQPECVLTLGLFQLLLTLLQDACHLCVCHALLSLQHRRHAGDRVRARTLLPRDHPLIVNIHISVVELKAQLIDLVQQINQRVGTVLIAEKRLGRVVLPLIQSQKKQSEQELEKILGL